MKRKLRSILAVFVGTAMLLSACSPKTDSPAPAATKTETPAEKTTTEATPEAPPASAGAVTELPRNETLYVNGLIWGPPANLSPFSTTPAFFYDLGRVPVYETLFMFNPMTGDMEPLLGTEFKWIDEFTLEVGLNTAAKFNNGTPMTAEDVVYSFNFHNRASTRFSNVWSYLDSVEKKDDSTVVFKLKADPNNRLIVENSLQEIWIIPQAIWEGFEAEAGGDMTKVVECANTDTVATGPYKSLFYDETRIAIVRNDDYWGKELFGSLPAPKYIAHMIYKSNDAGTLAFSNGEVDVSQQFIPEVWKLWADGKPFSTYLSELPYYNPGGMPGLIFNMEKPGLNNVDVRRAIAMSIDYQKVADLAMSGYSAPIQPSIAVMVKESEAKYIDNTGDLADMRWTFDVEKANALLDSIGAEKGADGIRVLSDGTRLGPFELQCPYGWTDWNASMEIVMQCGKAVGIEFTTNFPDAPVYYNNRDTGKFDIAMWTYAGRPNPSQPWQRANDMMNSIAVPPMGENAFRNYGRFQNDRADEILKIIPTLSDEAELKKLYTELDRIYLENIPWIPLMYRPSVFHTVYEGVWTGFPKQGDGTNIPPNICMDGTGIKSLYNLKNVQ